MLQGCNSPIVSAGAGFVKRNAEQELPYDRSCCPRNIAALAQRAFLQKKKISDREHFGGGPVSKRIGAQNYRRGR